MGFWLDYRHFSFVHFFYSLIFCLFNKMPSEDVSHFLESRDSVPAEIEYLCFSVSDTGPSCLGYCFDTTQKRHVLEGYGFSEVNFKLQKM